MVVNLQNGDCIEVMRSMPDNSVDAVVTDPPYGLSFMGKKWDYDVPSEEVWRECLRVLKPGGHLLAFAGTRTQHRMACRIEDAGFEIRDMIAWVYGSGFPKSLDVSKAIDKRGGNAHLTAEIGKALKSARESRGISAAEADRIYCNGVTLWSWYEGRPAGQQMPTADVLSAIAADWPELQRYADLIQEAEREVVGQKRTGDPVSWYAQEMRGSGVVNITTPTTPAARQWQGWGTALKPALEPITMARKPFTSSVAANVVEHGTGAINVDGCRVTTKETLGRAKGGWGNKAVGADNYGNFNSIGITKEGGRWPANLIHDDGDEVQQVLGDASRFFYCAKASKRDRDEGLEEMESVVASVGNKEAAGRDGTNPNNYTGGQRQRVEAGLPATEPRHNIHPTVKPTDLMRYLCRLVTQPAGVVLDPFMGSGSTGKAAVLEGFSFVGIERDPQYFEIAKRRVQPPKESSSVGQSQLW